MKLEAVLVAVFAALTLVASGTAASQPTSLSRGVPAQAITPASDWLVWRAFHDSLQFYKRQSPKFVPDVLMQRVDLTAAEAHTFLVAGQRYLQELARIDDDARAAVKARYQPNAEARFPPPDSARVRGPQGSAEQPPSILISAHTDDGRKLHDVLLADGFIAQVEQRRRVAVEGHIQRLEVMLGAEKIRKIEEWISVDVRPRVRGGMHGRPLPSARGSEYAPARR